MSITHIGGDKALVLCQGGTHGNAPLIPLSSIAVFSGILGAERRPRVHIPGLRSLSWGVWTCSSQPGNHNPALQERPPQCGAARAFLNSYPNAFQRHDGKVIAGKLLVCDRAPRLRQSSNRTPGGTKKTGRPAMTALLMLGRDVRGASDAGQACPVLCSREYERVPRCRTALRASWTAPAARPAGAARDGPMKGRHWEAYARDAIRTILRRGPPARGGRGLTPTPAGSLAGRPAGGSGAVGA